MRPGGTLLFMGGTGGRSRGPGMSLIAAATAAMPAGSQPRGRDRPDPGQPHRGRVRRHAAVRPLLGDDLEARREQLRATLPIRRVIGPEDIAALAVHLMTNTALTGATYDIDGGQQLV